MGGWKNATPKYSNQVERDRVEASSPAGFKGKLPKRKKKKEGPTSLISELADEGYFKSKRSISDIQKKLEERGHIYAQSSISPILTRLTRKRTIRRLKEKGTWVYVN